MKFLIFTFLFFVPFLANGAVVINEVAWMGSDNGGTSGQNAVDEWVELYNNGNDPVDLSGWILMAEDGKPSIKLSGSVSGGGFFLLERMDDESVPGIQADVIYKGALGNGGEVLILKNNGGDVIQKIDALNGWPAGDNSTKETMQWNGSSWVTAPPTPGSRNFGAGGGGVSPAEQASEASVQNPVKKDEVAEPAPKPEPKPAIQTPVKKTRGASESPPVNPSVELAAGGGATKEPAVKENPKESKKNAKQTEELQETVVQLQREIARLKKDAQKRGQEEKTAGIKNENPAVETQTANAVSAVSGSPAVVQNFASPANAGGIIWGWLLAVLGLGIFAGIGVVFIRRQGLS
ncbi:MAG: hypothetical protein GXP44_02820 [bacterium]|nr:hypothetical protein [bacterium]